MGSYYGMVVHIDYRLQNFWNWSLFPSEFEYAIKDGNSSVIGFSKGMKKG